MRYIKYCGEIPNLETIRKSVKLRSHAVQRQYRRSKLLSALGEILFWVQFVVLGGGLVFLSAWIMPQGTDILSVMVRFVGMGLLSGLSVILSAILASLVAAPLRKKKQDTQNAMLRDALDHTCRDLKQFYQFQAPYIVTKCYHSSNRRFDRHDVCLFVADGELRIAGNLQYGFFDPNRDLGCYCLSREEITFQDARHKDRDAVELQADGICFTLGTKARSFVETTFLTK